MQPYVGAPTKRSPSRFRDHKRSRSASYNSAMTTAETIRNWLNELQTCVRTVDYDRAQQLFAPDVVGFGTHQSIARGIEALRAE